MDCANCCEAFVGTYEGYYFTKGTDEIRLCRCCKVEYLMLGGLGWKLVENTKLTAKQIARIERIRAERAERIVDQRDSPNVFPYKKCAFCHERNSCGNYTDDDVWQCESCAPEDCADDEAAKDNIHYHRECVGCGDTPCVKPADPIDSPLCWSCDKHRHDDEYEPGEREFIEAVKNGDFDEMVRLFNLKKNKLI